MTHLQAYESFDPTSDAFAKWFGNSVLKDKQGNPLVMYHGTDAEPFDTFDAGRTTHNVSKFGFWFADDKDFCEMFGGRSMPVYLRVENPHVISQDKWNSLRGKYAKNVGWFEKWREELKAKGHDALIVKESYEDFRGFKMRNAKIVAVLSPLQIKSVDNKGTFNPDSANIYE